MQPFLGMWRNSKGVLRPAFCFYRIIYYFSTDITIICYLVIKHMLQFNYGKEGLVLFRAKTD